MRVTFIANPGAGRGRARALIDDIGGRARELGFEAALELTRGPGDGVRLAREARARSDVVAIVGGDGTVHEVINGLMPDPVPIVMLPVGSGNDFASLVSGPSALDELAPILHEGVGARLDILDFGDHYCANSAGLGFEGMVNKRSHNIRRLRGSAVYLAAVFKTLSTLAFPHFELTLPDGTTRGGNKLIVSIGNGVRTGGAFYLTPHAFPDDGLVDVCIVDPMSRLQVLRLLPRSLNGSHVENDRVEMIRVESLEVRTDPDFPMHIDGELIEHAPATFRVKVLHRVLPVLCRPDAGNRLKHPLEQILQV